MRTGFALMPGCGSTNGGAPFGSGAGAGRGPSGSSGAPAGGAGGFAGGGSPFGGDSASVTAAIRYAAAHGGGTIGVASQSTAAAAILSSNANVAGLGGFSGRESSVSVAWIAREVRSGHLRWVLVDGGPSFGAAGDTRSGSEAAMSIVAKACPAVTVSTRSGASVTMYDCQGRASAILEAARTR